MPHPWLDVPLNDYEEHMRSASVRQLEVLSELFRQVLQCCAPASVAVLGVAGGNGLEHIDPARTKRVVGVDINPDYLEAVRQRYQALPGLELRRHDLTEPCAAIAPVELVHAALIFEHAGLDPCLEHALSLAAEGGRFSAVLQLPATTSEDLAITPFPSVQRLRENFRLIEPARFRERLDENGFRLLQAWEHPLPGGKAFWVGIWERSR
ncbi:MAG TPA: hypothetical protein VMU19_08715 [Bryobacteraceae bacterium]|nr:hypothetical protein [Bryobacteraceae bacterium]